MSYRRGPMTGAEIVAREFHATYERLAPQFSWETQERSRVEWEAVPEENRMLMIAVVISLFGRGVIDVGPEAQRLLNDESPP